MTVDAFRRAREPAWQELEELLEHSGGRPERLGADGVRRLAARYREAAADLAYARRAFSGDPALGGLERLVGRARFVVYDSEPEERGLRAYFFCDYWREVRRHPVWLALAWAALIVPAALVIAWALDDPVAAAGVLPAESADVGGDVREGSLGLSASESAGFSVEIFTNNVRVTFVAFAAGLLLGIGSILLSAYNGMIIGGVIGLSIEGGSGQDVIELIAPHGVLELSCIAVAAAAGARMGWALIEPGSRTRRDALAATARPAALVVLATAPWLVLAGLVEGFVTPQHLPLGWALAVGFALATPYWILVATRGRT